MSPATQALLDAYFATFNAGEAAAHQALWAPDMIFFGSLIRTTVQGPGSTQGVYQTVRESVGLRRLIPVATFGDSPEIAVLTQFQGESGWPSVDGVLTLRLNPQGQLQRLSATWDPSGFLRAQKGTGGAPPPREALADKDPRVQATLGAYFQSFNSGDEAAHFGLMAPDVQYFGSLSRMESEGLASVKGVFRAVQESLGIRRVEPRRFFGDWPEVAVLLDLAREDGSGQSDAIFQFQFEEGGRIERIASLWNPRSFLQKRQAP